MAIKILIILLALLVALTFAWYFGSRPAVVRVAAFLVASGSIAPCRSDITPLFEKLTSDTSESSQAALKLIDLAKESPECREVVVNDVIRALNTADLENDESAFRLWARGSGVLGHLKAVEALDLLIAHLDLNDGLFSASMVHEPVVSAVTRMGNVAVPKLAVALKTSPKMRIRLAAAFCLGDIGGSEALDAMKSALNSETEECVRRFITLTLPTPNELANVNRPITAADGELLRQRILAYACNN